MTLTAAANGLSGAWARRPDLMQQEQWRRAAERIARFEFNTCHGSHYRRRMCPPCDNSAPLTGRFADAIVASERGGLWSGTGAILR